MPADLDAITEIYADAVRHGTASYELEPPTKAEMTQRFETLTAGGFPYLVAESSGRVVGYAYAGPFRPRPAYRFVVENSVYVSPDAKGRGIGRLLLERLIAEAAKLGFRQMIAVIGDGHAESASVKLHERLGFRHGGRLEGSGYKHGRWLDTTFMQLSMNGGADTAPDPDSLPERKFKAKS
jgi:phosphinothricin acetyltransferase